MKPLQPALNVQVAGGKILTCSEHFPSLTWGAQGYTFYDNFRVLELHSYDGIVGLDWLAKFSPMLTHWAQQWLAFQQEGQLVVLHGEGALEATHALIELHVVKDDERSVSPETRADI